MKCKALYLAKSDLYRYTEKVTVPILVKNVLINEAFKYLFWFRLSSARNILIRTIGRILHRYYAAKLGIWIPPTTKIGPGLYLGHPIGIVINSTAVIGCNCNLSQFTTIGSNDGKAAVIGDNVYIGPSVCLVENITIGNNVTIGAGAVVVKDVPPNATVAGCPAKVLSFNNPGRYINKKWNEEVDREHPNGANITND
jgi:serine O-acetyltransferase